MTSDEVNALSQILARSLLSGAEALWANDLIKRERIKAEVEEKAKEEKGQENV